jgi:hypothetical protein
MIRPLTALLCLVTALLPPRAGAQQPADLVQNLDSPDWQIRSRALRQLNGLAVADLPSSFAAKAIALLEQEAIATSSQTVEDEGEGYGEYLIALVKGVLRLNDPRATRGMARLGITVNRAAQEFVAAQGAAALPDLDDAWQEESMRPMVATTWARMLANNTGHLSDPARLSVIRKILNAASEERLGFAWAVDIAGLTVSIPVLENIAATDESDIVRGRAGAVSNRLGPIRNAMTPGAQVEQLSDALDALCLDGSGTRASACTSLSSMLSDAQNQLAANQESAARDALLAFAAQVDAGVQQGVWTADEQRILGGNSRYTVTRLIASIFLHGSGGTANPPTLSLSGAAPTATDASYKDSPSIAFSGGNTWKEVGIWQAAPAVANGTLTTLADARLWLGLKNSDDQGTNFDVRIEVAKNGTVIASGQALCVQAVTRNPVNAKEVVIPFGGLPPTAFNGTSDVLTFRVSTRIGTNSNGAFCGGHSNAVGLRLYFGAATRSARFDAKF